MAILGDHWPRGTARGMWHVLGKSELEMAPRPGPVQLVSVQFSVFYIMVGGFPLFFIRPPF